MSRKEYNETINVSTTNNGEFNSAFKATGTNHVYKNRKTIIKSIVLLFIPFLYAFFALWAFFNPLGNLDRLPIALVNQDTADNRVINRKVLQLDSTTPNKSGAYEFSINNINIGGSKKNFKVYYFDDKKTYEKHQDDETFLTEILINPNFTNQWNDFFAQVFQIIISGGTDIWEQINNIQDKPEITLQASYKVNPILGEINDFVLNVLKDNIFGLFFPIIVTDQVFNYWQQDANDPSTPMPHPNYDHLKPELIKIYDWVSVLIPGMGAHKEEFESQINSVINDSSWQAAKNHESDYWKSHNLTQPLHFIDFDINIIGEDKAPYGFGLGPYFMCIGMWVGSLLLTFNFTRNRDKEKSKFWSNYLAKSAWMVIFGLVQATILTTALLLLFNSTDLFTRFWELYLFMWFLGVAFPLIIQGIAHMFRDHDIGRFLIVFLLILQLSGSGGTFPVALEPAFFQVITYILPFTYAIKGLREILFTPNAIVLLINIAIIIVIVAIIMLLSLLLNWLYEYLDAKRTNTPKIKETKNAGEKETTKTQGREVIHLNLKEEGYD